MQENQFTPEQFVQALNSNVPGMDKYRVIANSINQHRPGIGTSLSYAMLLLGHSDGERTRVPIADMIALDNRPEEFRSTWQATMWLYAQSLTSLMRDSNGQQIVACAVLTGAPALSPSTAFLEIWEINQPHSQTQREAVPA